MGTLKFAPGETAKTVKVPLINDTLPEGAEAFSLALSSRTLSAQPRSIPSARR